MLGHGAPKLVLLLRGGGSEWLDPLGIGATLSLGLCVFAEFFCSLALIVGLFTRAAALILLINFWVVVFVVHMQSGGAQAELGMLYLVCYGTLMCTGAGPYSLDALLRRRLHYRSCERGRVAVPSSSAANSVSTK